MPSQKKFHFLCSKLYSKRYNFQRVIPIPREYLARVQKWLDWASSPEINLRNRELWLTSEAYTEEELIKVNSKEPYSMMFYYRLLEFKMDYLTRIIFRSYKDSRCRRGITREFDTSFDIFEIYRV